MRFFCPTIMDTPEEADKETFLKIMLKTRPEYAIIWDVHGKDVIEFQRRVYVAQYVVIDESTATVFYSQSRHYATRAKTLYCLENIVHVEEEAQWEIYLPPSNRFKTIQYYSPGLMEVPTEISMEDFIDKMLLTRPFFVVVWGIDLDDLEYIVSRTYVTSIMPVIGDTLYYSYGTHFAYHIQKKFNIPNHKVISHQNPKINSFRI